jgi:hypothetical protein
VKFDGRSAVCGVSYNGLSSEKNFGADPPGEILKEFRGDEFRAHGGPHELFR